MTASVIDGGVPVNSSEREGVSYSRFVYMMGDAYALPRELARGSRCLFYVSTRAGGHAGARVCAYASRMLSAGVVCPRFYIGCVARELTPGYCKGRADSDIPSGVLCQLCVGSARVLDWVSLGIGDLVVLDGWSYLFQFVVAAHNGFERSVGFSFRLVEQLYHV